MYNAFNFNYITVYRIPSTMRSNKFFILFFSSSIFIHILCIYNAYMNEFSYYNHPRIKKRVRNAQQNFILYIVE